VPDGPGGAANRPASRRRRCSPLITNIYGNGFNIYYDPFLLGNEYLGGLTYDLNDTLGGQLMPTPLPASAWLFLSGLAGLGLLGRRRKERTG